MTATATPCQQFPALWDVDHHMTRVDIDACVAACLHDCPALAACRAYLADCDTAGVKVHGIIAGQHRPWPVGGRWANVKPCGTVAAYYRHHAHGEDPCGPCRTAVANATAKARRRRKRKVAA
jgi:hypothetical protein